MLKKLLYGFALLSAVVSCSDDNYDWGTTPQHNDQPEVVTFGNGSVSAVDVIDFATIADGQEYVKVCNIVAPTATDGAYDSPKYEIDLEGDDAVYPLNENGEMKAADLKKYVEDHFGKAPYVREIPAMVSLWISNGETTIKTASSEIFNVKAKLSAPEISEHYYIIGQPSKWEANCTDLPFEHSDKNVYDDPIFTVTFSTECVNNEGDIWFAVVDDKTVAANDWSLVLGAKEGNGNNLIGETGLIARRSEIGNDGSFKLHVGDAKMVKMTLNMMEGTYLIETINFENSLSYVGTAGGWNNNGGSSRIALVDAAKGLYTGYIYGKQESYGNTFRLFSPSQLGSWDASTGNSDVNTFNGSIAAGGSDNNFEFTDGDGVYYVEYCITEKTISATKITNMNLVGDFNGWNQADDAQQMTWNADELCFVKEGAGVSANGWKFTANNDWGINLGGTTSNLVGNGDNLKAEGSTIKLYPCRNTSDNIYCTVE